MPLFPHILLNPEPPNNDMFRRNSYANSNKPVNMTRLKVIKLFEYSESPTLAVYEGGFSSIQHPIVYYIFKYVNK